MPHVQLYARRDGFRQKEGKHRCIISQNYRISPLTRRRDSAAANIFDSDPRAGRGDPAGYGRQGRAGDRADRNRQDARVSDPDHRAILQRNTSESRRSCSFPRANWPCRSWNNTTRCAASSWPPRRSGRRRIVRRDAAHRNAQGGSPGRGDSRAVGGLSRPQARRFPRHCKPRSR